MYTDDVAGPKSTYYMNVIEAHSKHLVYWYAEDIRATVRLGREQTAVDSGEVARLLLAAGTRRPGSYGLRPRARSAKKRTLPPI